MPRLSEESLVVGVEIGGTKLQAAVGVAEGGEFFARERAEVDAAGGAAAILEQVATLVGRLAQRHTMRAVGIGFGGPVDRRAGITLKSHQIVGWENVPLADWGRALWNCPVTVANDCDSAALAEARLGAGRGARAVLYVTAGTGVGGGFVLDGRLFGETRPAAVEIGHLRPGLQADRPDDTVESLASGWGLAAAARQSITGVIERPFDQLRRQVGSPGRAAVQRRLADAREADKEYKADLLLRCDGKLETLTAKQVGQAAAEGNEIAIEVLRHGCQALGWGIAQAVTLLAPEVVVVGGGVSLVGEQLFHSPLREAVDRYVFPPLRGTYELLPAALGEDVVVHGAMLLAAALLEKP